MTIGEFRYEITARSTVAAAVALLADVPRLVKLHPLAIAVKELAAWPGALRSTAVTSRLGLGPFSFDITYRADLISVTATEVLTIAHQRPKTVLRSHATISEAPGGAVRVAVHITFDSPWPLFSYGFRKAQFAHRGLADGIKKELES
jgi:hypothetical protein